MTRNDVRHGNADLLQKAIGLLQEGKPHTIRITTEARRGRRPLVTVKTRNVSWIEPTVDGRALGWRPVQGGKATIDLDGELTRAGNDPVLLDVAGYDDGDRLVVRRRTRVPLR
jgi:hypothetical protein